MTDGAERRANLRVNLRLNNWHTAARATARYLAGAVLGLACLAPLSAAELTTDPFQVQTTFNIPAQPLSTSLKQLANQAGIQILFEERIVSGRQAPAIEARETPLQAIGALLKGTDLEFTAKDRTVVVRKKSTDGAADAVAARHSSEAGLDEQVQIEEVVVTAQHRTEKVYDVPMGITALSGGALEKLQARSFEDYVAMVPGLALQHPSLPGANTLTLRGLNAGGAGATVSVYVDDSPFGSSSSLANGSSYSANFDPWDMQRIEVLRGPQGTLYGASSEGGLVKFVTNAPDPAAFAGLAEVGGENVAHGGSDWSAKGMVNVPLGTKAAFRLSAYGESLPGYISDPLLHKNDVNAGQKNGVRASLLLLPTSDLSIRLTAFKQELRLNGTSYVDVDNDTRQPVYRAFTQVRGVAEPQRFTYENYAATVSWNLGWANALSVTSYGKSNNHSFLDLTYSAFDVGQSEGQYFSQLLGFPTGLGLTDESSVKKLTQELRLQSNSSERLEWELGAYYTRETAQLYQPNDLYTVPDHTGIGGAPGYYYLLILNSLYKEGAGFANLTYHINPKVDVEVGGRFARNNQTYSFFQESGYFGAPPSTIAGVASANKFLYSFAPRWHVTDDLLLYARVASGYQSGGPNPLPATAPPEVPREFFPDSTVNYEVGLRSRLLNRRLSIDLAAFRIDWSKVQINGNLITPQGNYGYIGNGGSATSQGLEWTVGLTPLENLTLTLTGAYIDAKLTADAPAVGGLSGDHLPNSPQWSFSLDTDYTWHAFDNYRAFAGATWSYVGVEYGNFSSANDVTIPPDRMPGYTMGNLRVGLDNNKWRFSAYVKNVTNNHAIALFTNSGYVGFPASAIYNQPRTVGVTASVKF